MSRNVYILLATSILIGVLFVSVGTLYYQPLIAIGASLLTGAIVGIVVSYSQSYISAEVSENIRIRNDLLADYKDLVNKLTNQSYADKLAYSYFKPDYKNLTQDEMKAIELIKESGQHWKPFYKSFNEYSKIVYEFNEATSYYEANLDNWIRELSNASYQLLCKQVFNIDILGEFSQNKLPFSSEELNSFTFDDVNSEKIQKDLKNVFKIIIDRTFADKLVKEDLKSYFTQELKSHLEIDFNQIESATYSDSSPHLSIDIWNATYVLLRSILGSKEGHYHDYNALYPNPRSPKSIPDFKVMFTETLPILVSEIKEIVDPIVSLERIKSIFLQKNGAWEKLEKSFPEIYNSYQLPGKLKVR